MAIDKKMWHEEDDQIPALIQQDIDDFEEYDLANFEIKHASNGEPPKHRWDLGRNCPRCAGRLVIKEITENEHIYLHCKSCKLQVFADDIEKTRETSDALYRSIPDELMLKWKR